MRRGGGGAVCLRASASRRCQRVGAQSRHDYHLDTHRAFRNNGSTSFGLMPEERGGAACSEGDSKQNVHSDSTERGGGHHHHRPGAALSRTPAAAHRYSRGDGRGQPQKVHAPRTLGQGGEVEGGWATAPITKGLGRAVSTAVQRDNSPRLSPRFKVGQHQGCCMYPWEHEQQQLQLQQPRGLGGLGWRHRCLSRSSMSPDRPESVGTVAFPKLSLPFASHVRPPPHACLLAGGA
jgi:hypothetical protein